VAVAFQTRKQEDATVKMMIAGHGHEFHTNPDFVKWMKKHDVNFLVSFAYPDIPRLKFAKSVRLERKKKER